FGEAPGRSSSRRVGHAPTGARRNPAAAKRLPGPPGEPIVYYGALLRGRVALSCWHPSVLRTSNLRKYARLGAIWIVLTPAIFAQNLGIMLFWSYRGGYYTKKLLVGHLSLTPRDLLPEGYRKRITQQAKQETAST